MNLNLLKNKIKDFLVFLEVEKNSSEHTLRAYKADLQQVISFWEGISIKEKNRKYSLDTILRRYILSLFYKKISKATLARKLSCLRSFAFFMRSNGIKLNINFKAPRLDKKLPVILSVDEIFYLLDTLKNDDLPTKLPYRDRTIFELIYATGVRCSELVQIKISNIDFENKAIKVFGKGRKERIVFYGNKAKAVLESYINDERTKLLKDIDRDYLFLNYLGSSLSSRSVQRIIKMFRKLLKIDRSLTPHKLRHSFATHLLSQGMDLRMIQELLGHKTIATTEIYTQISAQQLVSMCDEKHPLNDMDYLFGDIRK
ncbi:site-specific tyrosine recombinase/integron integrase [Candidatus Dependentiae bacterium]